MLRHAITAKISLNSFYADDLSFLQHSDHVDIVV
jgi:hypothetical protein